MTNKFDCLLEDLGTGKWNLLGISLLMYWIMQLPLNSLGGTYMTPPLEHTCRIPPEGTPIYIEGGGEDNDTTIDTCWYHINTTDGMERLPCTDWDFDNSTYLATLTSEFQLVCDREYLRPTFTSIYYFGALIASPIIGFLSDSYGRKTVMTFGFVFYAIFANIINWLPNISSILVARFVIGLMHSTSCTVGYTLALEKCEPRYRATVGIVCFSPWIIGMLYWAGFGYLIREWRWLMFVTPLPSLLALTVVWFVDESPRWLIVKGHHDRALQLLQKAARWNGRTLPPEEEIRSLMKEIEQESKRETTKVPDGSSKVKSMLHTMENETLILFRTKMMRRVTLSVYAISLVCGMVYDGLSLSGGNLGTDPYVYMAFCALMDIPGTTITIPMVNYLGRRKSNIICFFITGVLLLMMTVIPKGSIATTLTLIGKMTLAMAYQVIYLHATELFPTQVRVRGVGTSDMVSQLGSICAPFLIDGLGNWYWWLPSVVCGGAAIFACAVTFILPETLGMALPDTVVALEESAKLKSREKSTNLKEKEENELSTIEEILPLST